MSNAKHTPGPWILSDYYSDCLTVTDKDGFEIVSATSLPILQGYSEKLGIDHWADSPDASRELSEEEADANARLIAAAPELLDVAHSILADDMLQYLPAEYVAKVRAAIAKATGSQS